MNKSNDTDGDENNAESSQKPISENFDEQTSENNLEILNKLETVELSESYVGNVNADSGTSVDSVTGDIRKNEKRRDREIVGSTIQTGEHVNKSCQRLEFDASITEDLCIERMKDYEQSSSNRNRLQHEQDRFESLMPTIVSSNKLSRMRMSERPTQSINEEEHSAETVEQEPLPQQPETLEPNNPLMARYQAALQTHLLRQNKKLEEELLHLEGTLRQKQKQREHLSLDICNTQQAVNQQHSMIDKKTEELMKVINDRDKLVALIYSEKNILKEKSSAYFDTQKKVENMCQEKEALALLISQFVEWEEVQNSQIKISQRISEKQRMDKAILTQEKLQQDMLMLTLATEVLKLNKVFDDLEKNIKDKQADIAILAQSVTEGSVDLEELQSENKNLLQTWNYVILRVEQRDKALVDIKQELQNVKDQFHTLECQIDSFKRSTQAEIKRNGQLSISLNRIEEEFETLQRVYAAEEEKRKHLNENLAQLINMIELTKKDLHLVVNEGRIKDKEKRMLQNEVDKYSLQKYNHEEEILNILHDQKVASQTDKHASSLLSQLHNNCRKQEITLAKFENDLAKVLLDIEEENKLSNSNLILIEEEKLVEQDRDTEIEMMDAALQNLNRNVIRKQGQIDLINNKLSEIKSKTGGFELSADERQISSLEKTIIETDLNTKKLQGQWVREQRNIVNLTHQHNQQLHQINIYRKQLLVLDQKYMKLEMEIEKYKKDEINTLRAVDDLQKKLVILNQQFSEKRNYKDILDNENFATQSQLICDLKDAEVSALSMLTEMCNLEIEKDELRKKLSELQRESLAWEKKLQLATEMKITIDKAKGEGGDVAVMKAEIHRMEVRLAQLRKAQEKLSQDMEMCIIRRDGILDSAQAKEKRSVNGIHYTRQQFTKKLDDLRNKIKQTELEIRSVVKKINESTAKLNELKETVSTQNKQLEGLQDAANQMQLQINEGHLHRQGNLELLVYRQRKIRFYGDFKCGRYNLFYRNDTSLELTSQRQKGINTDLISVIEYLTTDFPSLGTPLKQILNTLHLQAV